MAALRWTAEADQWLKDIFDYIALELWAQSLVRIL